MNFDYSESYAEYLSVFNYWQSYVANYNYGNILYKNEKYDEAIDKYKKALAGYLPKYKECKIRINYALAICKKVELYKSDTDSIDNAIKEYEEAISILTEKGCAHKEDNNGRSYEAQQLKNDIQNEINKLEQMQNKKQEKQQDEEKNKDKKEEKGKAETIEEKMKEIKEEATSEQREIESKFKNYNRAYNRNQKNW